MLISVINLSYLSSLYHTNYFGLRSTCLLGFVQDKSTRRPICRWHLATDGGYELILGRSNCNAKAHIGFRHGGLEL